MLIILFKEHIREDLNNDQKPDQGAYDQGVATGDFSHHSHGVHNAQIPVDADAGEEADAAIKVEVEAEACHLAERLAEVPVAVAPVIAHEERQSGQVQQIRHPKVEHEDVDVSDVFPAGAHASQPPDVGHHPDHEHSDEHRRQKGVRKIQVDGVAVGVVGSLCDISRHLLGFRRVKIYFLFRLNFSRKIKQQPVARWLSPNISGNHI